MIEFISSLEEVAEPRVKLMGLVGGFLLLISVFLPWESLSYMIYSISFSGLSLSGVIGATGIIAGLLCILAVFLANTKATGMGHIAMGALALFVMLAVWFSQPTIHYGGLPSGAFPEGFPKEEWERMIRELEEGLSGIVHLQAGFFLYILSSIIVILGGLLELREGEQLKY